VDAVNTSIMHARSNEAIRPMSNDEKLADRARKYFAASFHRRPDKPRIRVTVPAPLSNNAPADAGKDK